MGKGFRFTVFIMGFGFCFSVVMDLGFGFILYIMDSAVQGFRFIGACFYEGGLRFRGHSLGA